MPRASSRTHTAHPRPPGLVPFQALLLEIPAAPQKTITGALALSQEGRTQGLCGLRCSRLLFSDQGPPKSLPPRVTTWQPAFSVFLPLLPFLCFCLFVFE